MTQQLACLAVGYTDVSQIAARRHCPAPTGSSLHRAERRLCPLHCQPPPSVKEKEKRRSALETNNDTLTLPFHLSVCLSVCLPIYLSISGAYLHGAKCTDNIHPSDRFFGWVTFGTHEYCRDEYAKYMMPIMATREPQKGILRFPGGNRPEDLSLFHSLTCKNNVILDYYGVWRTYTIRFTHG